jgi:hypothetical protein
LFVCCTRIQYVLSETYPFSIYYFLRYKHYSEVRFRILHGARSFQTWRELRASGQRFISIIKRPFEPAHHRTMWKKMFHTVIAILRNPLWAWYSVLVFYLSRALAPRRAKENRVAVHHASAHALFGIRIANFSNPYPVFASIITCVVGYRIKQYRGDLKK